MEVWLLCREDLEDHSAAFLSSSGINETNVVIPKDNTVRNLHLCADNLHCFPLLPKIHQSLLATHYEMIIIRFSASRKTV